MPPADKDHSAYRAALFQLTEELLQDIRTKLHGDADVHFAGAHEIRSDAEAVEDIEDIWQHRGRPRPVVRADVEDVYVLFYGDGRRRPRSAVRPPMRREVGHPPALDARHGGRVLERYDIGVRVHERASTSTVTSVLDPHRDISPQCLFELNVLSEYLSCRDAESPPV